MIAHLLLPGEGLLAVLVPAPSNLPLNFAIHSFGT